jgi:hypothetical protein
VEAAGDDYVVAAGSDLFVFVELNGTHDGFADVQQLAIPPDLFGGSTPMYACAQALN